MCLFFITLIGGPRLGGVVWWLFYPDRWNSAFTSIGWPILGLIFLPWTTIMWVSVAPFGHVAGYDWIWLGFGVLFDLMSFGSSGYGNRDRVPGYH